FWFGAHNCYGNTQPSRIRSANTLIVRYPSAIPVHFVLEPPTDRTAEHFEFLLQRRPSTLGQYREQVLEHRPQATIHLDASFPVLADFAHCQRHVVGPVRRAIDHPRLAVRVSDYAFVEPPTAD